MKKHRTARKLITRLGLMPPNILTPKELSSYFDSYCEATNDEDTQNNYMTGISAVGAGKGYLGIKYLTNLNSQIKIAVVGKGITFDSGGISIKPAKNMSDMKFDMLGAATVLGLCESFRKVYCPHKVYGYGCIAENTFSSGQMRPGDVITYPDGTRVEIDNTDAEGRLVLADGILAAKSLHVDIIITIATLTGAARAALGEATALFSNNDILASKILDIAKEEGELLWRLPIFQHHRKAIKADKRVADIKNCSDIAGASTAAAFLEHFVAGTSWIHLDIAGSAYKDGSPTCVMLDTLHKFIQEI